MSRAIHADVIAEFAKSSFQTAILIKVDFATPIYLSDYSHDITYGGNTYQAGGELLGMAAVSETSDIRVGSIGIGLSGVNQTSIATLLTEETTNREVIVYRAAISSSGAIIGNPILVYNGKIIKFDIEDDESSSQVTLTVASHWADFDLKAGRKTNNSSQQMIFPSDLGMAFSGLMKKDIKWGRA